MQQPAEKPPLWYNFLLLALASTLPPQIHPEVFLLWDGLRQLSAILTLDVHGTAHSRSDWSLVNTPSMMASYARLTADLRAEGQRNNHEVSLLDSEQELQRRITRCGRGEEGGREGGRERGEGEEKGKEEEVHATCPQYRVSPPKGSTEHLLNEDIAPKYPNCV